MAYKKAKNKKQISSSAQATCPYYDEQDRTLAQDTNINPCFVSGNTNTHEEGLTVTVGPDVK